MYFCMFIAGTLWKPKVGSIETFQSKNIVVRIERIPDSPFSHNKDFTVSADRKRYAYTSCQLRFFQTDHWCIVADGNPLPIHDTNIRSYFLIDGTMWPYASVAFSSNANHIKYNVDGAVYIDENTPKLQNADRVIDVLYLPNNNTLYCIEWQNKKYLQINDNKRIPYDDNNWVQAIAVDHSIDSVATIQDKKDSTVVGFQVEIIPRF